MPAPLLEVRDLTIGFPRSGHQAVSAVSFDLMPGEILGIVGESGSGKSLTCMAVAGLLPATAQASGKISLAGRSYDAGIATMALRSGTLPPVGIIFQDPVNSLNPMMPIGNQIAEAAALAGAGAAEAREIALDLLNDVRIPSPTERYHHYPMQFSGGMCQRVMIAIALAMKPTMVIADEPTTALDVTVQAQVVALLTNLARKHSVPLIFISHDLDLVAQSCDRIGVMRRGELVEIGRAADVYLNPSNEYTRMLLRAMPGKGEPLSKLYEVARS